ncbi:hypothetical protein G7K_1409-t1 [Saitoella complicata NRRL Y-17804]|uniref:Uncharacterized protein n=1 Tax=Saitoella complicata (strain BCRC 22490 / CBS 7301 / JCM 7358 / NBRC 10748 / NRRL Y-17804) TaxID=698492 RepID=A0A0E9NBI5_SAICN|nr:hypothetical protein G7K_1409-t1 [Saitoella complicata NRRL Y-17804]
MLFLSWLLSVRRTAETCQGPRPTGPSRIRPRLPTSSSNQVQWLRTKAQRTQPLEPILFPKLRIYFADFPYLHCSIN